MSAPEGEHPDPGPAPAPARGLLERPSPLAMNVGVILFGLMLYLPFAWSYGLFDPWETHYAEVARQMAERGDYISLWWPGAPIDAEHFWSKPVLSFWLMSLSMRLHGVGHGGPDELAVSTLPEWAVRLPFCLLGVLGIWAVYLLLDRLVSRRAGVLGAVVLGTSPLYSLVARQAMTDMAFVGPMTMALALGALALFDDEDRELPRRRGGPRGLSWPHHPLYYTAVALFVVTALPQLVVDCIQLRWHVTVAGRSLIVPGVVLMLLELAGFVGFLLLSTLARYKAPLYLFIAAILCGVAILAKGLAGLGLPVIIFVAYLAFTWNWKRLGRAQIKYGVLVALIAAAVVAVPWHHAMLVRHGFPFWDELYGDNHWRRLVTGRHGDRGTFEYFLRELGYAVLPWAALAPAALVAAVMRPIREVRRQGVFWFGAIWFIAGYVLVSLSVTKFHHYILPAIPGLAIAIACFLDDLLSRRSVRAGLLAALVGVPVLALVVYDLVAAQNGAQRLIWLFSYDYINAPKGRTWPTGLDFRPALIAFAAAAALPALLLWIRPVQRFAVAGVCLVAVAFTYYLLDFYVPRTAAHWSQKPLIAAYYKLRRSPDEKLLVWQMYWRGENFYTKNAIHQGPQPERTVFLGDKNAENLKDWITRHRRPGRRAFLLVETKNYGQVPAMLPADIRGSLKIVFDQHNKFTLAQVDL
jgi:4-amino-4-deoxy-L-arabinose transferase-like glycosyltransferase